MGIYGRYQKSRNASWQCLINNGITKLPVKVSVIIKNYGIKLHSYQSAKDYIYYLGLKNNMVNDAFCVYVVHNQQWWIFHNEMCSTERNRFSIAHELGHILLGHNLSSVSNITYSIFNREIYTTDVLETEANIFASRLLAPACVLWGLGVQSADEIANICNISKLSAQHRADRMEVLYEREQDHIKKYNRS